MGLGKKSDQRAEQQVLDSFGLPGGSPLESVVAAMVKEFGKPDRDMRALGAALDLLVDTARERTRSALFTAIYGCAQFADMLATTTIQGTGEPTQYTFTDLYESLVDQQFEEIRELHR